jgi:tetratricopeptide (TPR) repeat protein
MAVFGFPTVREDDAERAVRAAAAMVASLPELNEEIERQWDVRIGMRTGINTGEVVESGEGLVVGDPVNVAARLEQAAADGEVLIGEETWRLVRDKVTLQAVAPLDLKGKSEPVPAYRLVSTDPPTVEANLPFVGRDDELAKLLDVYERAVSDNRARVATVIGSAGVGKTRLARELAASVAGRALVLEARCEPAGTSTFAPIADALRDAASIDESATDDAIVAGLSSLLPEEHPDRDRIASRAATVLGAGDPGPPEETFWGVRRIFEALARARPLVLVLDDVHWAEPMLLDLIEHLADWTRDASMLLLALARPDIRESRPSLAEGTGRDATVVVLEGLDSEASVRLAQDLLDADQLPPELIERVLASSEGNPLFLRELLRMLVDDGVLLRDDGSWVVTVDAHEVDVPPTIHALLSARIDRLRADERAVVERASVIGKQFYRGAVAALAPAAVATHLDGHLETLRRKELVEPEGTYWIDEPVFRFHHVLIRDAAYRRLLKEARAELHERFAEWLERKAGDLVGEHEEVIGYHLEQAHEYRRQLGALDETGRELGVRAAQHLAAAGRRAIERDDLTAAAPLLARALDRLEQPDPEILIDRCEALLDLGDVAAGAQCVDELRGVANTPRLEAWAESFAAQLANLIDPAHLRETAERAAAAAQRFAEIGDAAGAAKAHHVHAETLGRLGQMRASHEALDHALAAAREVGDRRRANSVLGSKPFTALWGPNSVVRASGDCLDVIRVLRITTGSPAVEARALRCQAVLEALRGRHDAARKMLESSRTTLEDLGLRHGLLETDVFAGVVEQLAGNAGVAEQNLRRAYEGFTRLGVGADAAYAAALLARACLSLGRNDEAEDLTRESERLGGDDLKTGIAWRAVRGAAIARRGEVEESLRLAREAVALAEGTDALVDHGDARRALGLALHEAGRTDEARAEVARAVELYETKGATAAVDRALGAIQPVAAPAVRRAGFVRTSTAVDPSHEIVWNRIRDAFVAHDWDGLAAQFDDDVVVVDVRAGLRSEVSGRAAWIDGIARTYEGRVNDVDIEIVAARDRAGVVRMLVHGRGDDAGGPWETDRLVAYQLARDADRIVRFRYFDPDAGDAALAIVTEWAGVRAQPGVDPEHVAFWSRFRTAMVTKDWDGLAAMWHADAVYADRRPGLQSETIGGDEVARVNRQSFATREFDYEIDVLASRGDAGIFLGRYVGRGDEHGGPFEAERLVFYILDDDGRLHLGELHDPVSQREAVFAKLDEHTNLGRVRTAAGVDAAAAQPLLERMRRGFVEHDWDAFDSCFRADLVVTDERRGLRARTVGRDALVEGLREAYEQRRFDSDWRILATAGRAGVVWQLFYGSGDATGGPWESERLFVYELDAHDELIARYHYLDPGAHDAAFTLLDQWSRPAGVSAAPGTDPEHAVLRAPGVDEVHARRWEPIAAAVATKNWAALESRLDPHLVGIDRRSGLRAEYHGSAQYVAALRDAYGPRDFRFTAEILGGRGNTSVTKVRWTGVGDELGGPWVTERVNLVEFDDNDRAVRVEQFDDAELAFARLRELAGGGVRASTGIERRHVESWERFRSNLASKSWDAFASTLDPALVHLDRRRGLQSEITDLDTYIRAMRESFGTRVIDYDLEILSTRGNTGVTHGWFFGPGDDVGGPFEAERLVYYELGDDDRFVRFELLDPDDREAEFALVESTARGGVRASVAGAERFVRVMTPIRAAHIRKDWDAVRAQMADGFTFTDHRPGLRHTSGPDEYVEGFRDSFGTREDLDVDMDVIADAGNVSALYIRWFGPADDAGGPWETDRIGVITLSDDDKVAKIDIFDPSERETALAFLDARDMVRAPEGADPAHKRLWENVRRVIRYHEWDDYSLVTTADIVVRDMRRGLRSDVFGRDTLIHQMRETYDARRTDYEVEILAARGRAAVATVRLFGPGDELGGPWEQPRIFVYKLAADVDQAAEVSIFDPDQEAEAFAMLADMAGGGVRAHAGIDGRFVSAMERFRAAAIARNEAAVRACMSEDFAFVDRRSGLRSETGLDGWFVGLEQAYVGREIDIDVHIVAANADAFVVQIRWFGRDDAEGGPWESVRLAWARLDANDRHVRVELFDPEREADALELLREPDAASSVRYVAQRFIDAYNSRDWTALEELIAPGFVHDDHRPSGWGTAPGFDALIARINIGLEEAPDAQLAVDPWIREHDGVGMFGMPMRGHVLEDAGDFRLDRVMIAVADGERLVRLEAFGPDQQQLADERFDALASG